MVDAAQELHEGLVTWWLGSEETRGTELREVWDDAFRRFDSRLSRLLELGGDDDSVLSSPKGLLEDCFAASLADHQAVLDAFVEALPRGWERLLRSAVVEPADQPTEPQEVQMVRRPETRSAPGTPT